MTVMKSSNINREDCWYCCFSVLLGFTHVLYYISKIVFVDLTLLLLLFSERLPCGVILIRKLATKIYFCLCLCLRIIEVSVRILAVNIH
jgi:hypothetical protein